MTPPAQPRFEYLITITIFLLGGAFASLLMWYGAISKHLDGVYNESIFIHASYFGSMAALALILHHILEWGYTRQQTRKGE